MLQTSYNNEFYSLYKCIEVVFIYNDGTERIWKLNSCGSPSFCPWGLWYLEASEQHHLKVQKVLKSLRTQYYSLKKNIEAQSVKLNVRDGVIRLWIRGLTEFMSTMSSKSVKDLMKKYKTLEGLKVDNSKVD